MRGIMIDDGKYDPPETKIEDTYDARMDFKVWEIQFQQGYLMQEPKRRKRLSDRFWNLLITLGNTYIQGGY
jgi:hypothetical protein